MKKLYVFLIGLSLVSCSSTRVYMDYDEKADISSYKTYDYFIIKDNGFNDLDIKRVKKALDHHLTEKNITKKTIPDFSINFYAETYTIESQNNIGVGIGGGNGAMGGGVSSGIPINTSRDMIAFTVEFIDALNKELFWQCIVEIKIPNTGSPTERQTFINEIVKKALDKYPPKAEKKQIKTST